jgi:hypothetical protein
MGIESDRSAGPGREAGVSPYDALPGLAAAMDEEAMRRHVGAALFGTAQDGWTVERCAPTRPLYVPGESCLVRYRFRARNGTTIEPTVMGRVFADGEAATRYMREKLAPLATRMRGRPEVAAFATPAALIEPLHAVVHVWPVDGELPTLVDATDRAHMMEVLRQELPRALGEPFAVRGCEVELVSYRRRGRCVLRYTVTGDGDAQLVLYGKVTMLGGEALVADILRALHRRVGARLTLPRSFGARPELRLSLLEAVSGSALVGPALVARLGGGAGGGPPALEDMVGASGEVAAALHGSGVELGRPRTLADELAGLRAETARTRLFDPSFEGRARSWLERIAALDAATAPLEPCLAHGDFKHEQVLFDGERCALVDVDGLCRAEPALDLGKFVAHLRYETRRIAAETSLGDQLAERFVGAYIGAVGVRGEPAIRARTAVYESVALLRLALRAHHDLDEARRDRTAVLLDERLAVTGS